MTLDWDTQSSEIVVFDTDGTELARVPTDGDGVTWSGDYPDAVDEIILDEADAALAAGDMARALDLLRHVVASDITRQ